MATKKRGNDGPGKRKWPVKPKKRARGALQKFIDTINATGGIMLTSKSEYAPVGDEEWVDLGFAYLDACEALGVEPKYVEEG
jgi:hypothetical protein